MVSSIEYSIIRLAEVEYPDKQDETTGSMIFEIADRLGIIFFLSRLSAIFYKIPLNCNFLD
jgi:hypothetical protein